MAGAVTVRAMSRENVQSVLAGYEAYEHGDVEVEAVFASFHPGIVWETLEHTPDPDFNKGHEAVAGLWASWAETFDDFWARPGPQLVAGGGKVVVEHRTGGRQGGETPAARLGWADASSWP
jgi:ketosteroid isomerase-like protein